MKQGILLLLALAAVACGATAGKDEPKRTSVPDTEVGLARGSVFDTPAPAAVTENDSEPGEMPAPPRPYPIAPPVVPHGVREFLPITRSANACIDCHLVEEKVEGEATPVPESHFIDYRNAPRTAGKTPDGARYNCAACHVPQTGAAPLVENRFGQE
jgi:cytochrome c-type protein NapB